MLKNALNPRGLTKTLVVLLGVVSFSFLIGLPVLAQVDPNSGPAPATKPAPPPIAGPGVGRRLPAPATEPAPPPIAGPGVGRRPSARPAPIAGPGVGRRPSARPAPAAPPASQADEAPAYNSPAGSPSR